MHAPTPAIRDLQKILKAIHRYQKEHAAELCSGLMVDAEAKVHATLQSLEYEWKQECRYECSGMPDDHRHLSCDRGT